MKLLKKVLGVLTIVLSAAALVLFFTNFGKVIFDNGDEVVRTGTQFAFGSSFEGSKTGWSSKDPVLPDPYRFDRSFSSLSIKFKGSRWATIVVSLIDSIFMLVVACRNSDYYLDMQGLPRRVYHQICKSHAAVYRAASFRNACVVRCIPAYSRQACGCRGKGSAHHTAEGRQGTA